MEQWSTGVLDCCAFPQQFARLLEGPRCGSPVGTFPSVELTPVAVHLSLVPMGDKSPKATSKAAAQKQAKAAAASQKKKDVASAKHVPKK